MLSSTYTVDLMLSALCTLLSVEPFGGTHW